MERESGDKRNTVLESKKHSSSDLIQYDHPVPGEVNDSGNEEEGEGQGSGDITTTELPPPSPRFVDKISEVDCAAVIQKHLAAIKIQSRFRGWLLRTNMRMVTKCVVRIQALWRGALVRMHRKGRMEEAKVAGKEQGNEQKPQPGKVLEKKSPRSPKRSPRRKIQPTTTAKEAAAGEQKTTAGQQKATAGEQKATAGERKGTAGEQKAAAGEKKVQDEFREGRTRNEDVIGGGASIPQANAGKHEKARSLGGFGEGDMEGSQHSSSDSLCPSNDGDLELRTRMERALQCLETILKDVCNEDLSRVSKARVAELVEYLDTNPTATKGDVCLANSLARICPTAPSAGEDDISGGGSEVKSDPEKVRLLKDAIRLLRQRIQAWENRKLYPYHHLARTTAIPGIFSDPFSGELTEVEKSLMDLRFNDRKDADSYVSPAKAKTENTKQLKELMEMDPDEKDTLEKIYNFNQKFKFNYFPPEEATNDDACKRNELIQVPKSPPPFTTLFKANPKRRR